MKTRSLVSPQSRFVLYSCSITGNESLMHIREIVIVGTEFESFAWAMLWDAHTGMVHGTAVPTQYWNAHAFRDSLSSQSLPFTVNLYTTLVVSCEFSHYYIFSCIERVMIAWSKNYASEVNELNVVETWWAYLLCCKLCMVSSNRIVCYGVVMCENFPIPAVHSICMQSAVREAIKCCCYLVYFVTFSFCFVSLTFIYLILC